MRIGFASDIHKLVEGRKLILSGVVIPSPKGEKNNKLKALIFDSVFDSYKGVIVHVRIIDGELNPTARVLSMVKEWILLHQDELLQMWETQDLHEIEPLK